MRVAEVIRGDERRPLELLQATGSRGGEAGPTRGRLIEKHPDQQCERIRLAMRLQRVPELTAVRHAVGLRLGQPHVGAKQMSGELAIESHERGSRLRFVARFLGGRLA